MTSSNGMHGRPRDTDAETWNEMTVRWRAMSPAEKVEVVTALSAGIEQMALAGVRIQHPGATPAEERYHLAVRRYGQAFADEHFSPGSE